MRLKLKYSFWVVLLFPMVFFACKKDATPYFGNGSAVTLSSSTTTITPSAKDSASTVLSLSWTNPKYATDSAHQKFLIQMDTTETFTHPSTFEADGPLSQDYTGNQLNTVLASFGFSPGKPFTIHIRVVSSYANNNEPYISNAVTVTMTGYTVPITLKSSPGGPLVLSLANATKTAISLNWNASPYGNDTINYELQLDTVGGNFAHPQIVQCSSSLDTSFTNDALNTAIIMAGVAAGTAKNIEFRAVSYIGTNYTNKLGVSNVITSNITSYIPFITYYVPGDYEGWNAATAATVAATTPDLTAFEGYVNVPSGGSYDFKITSAPDFNHTNYGNGGTGMLSTDPGAGNLNFGGAGYFRIIANTTSLTWSATATTWAIIGDAPVASNNWSNDVPMTYNASAGTWSVTTDCNAGSFKFRANSDWNDPSNNFGVDNNGKLAYNAGNNISIPSAGNYTITLNLSSPRNYTYTLTKN